MEFRLHKFLRRKILRVLWKMNTPFLKTRFCNLDHEQMKYVNEIAYAVSEPTNPIPHKMSKVLDHLYLGSFDDAVEKDTLREAGITHIVNTVDESYMNCRTGAKFYGDGFSYLGFTAHDEERYPIMRHFDETFQFIESARKNNGKCFIHCLAGINRSGALATAYVMLHKDIGPISAAKLVFDARGVLLSNNGFIERLVKLAIDKNLLDKDQNIIKEKYK